MIKILLLAVLCFVSAHYLYVSRYTPEEEISEFWLCIHSIRGVCIAMLALLYGFTEVITTLINYV